VSAASASVADPRPEELHVVYGGLHVATLRERRQRLGIDCYYTAEARARWPGNTPVLSCSLPLGSSKLDATPFLEGLLPEGQARAIIAADRGVPATDIWMLLAYLGRDVAGALSIAAENTSLHRAQDVHAYAHEDLEEAVAGLPRSPLDLHDDSELSLAGIQNKMTLVALGDGRWGGR
jgi:serine/threonine-protein kinase HipA